MEDQNAVPRPAQLAKYSGAHHSTMPWRRAAACPPPIGGCPMALVACARPTACTAWTSAPGPQRRPSQSSPQISFPSSSLPSRPSRRLFLATCESAHCARGHNTPIQPPTVILRGRPGSPCDLQLLARDVTRSVPLRDTFPSPSLSLSTIAFDIAAPQNMHCPALVRGASVRPSGHGRPDGCLSPFEREQRLSLICSPWLGPQNALPRARVLRLAERAVPPRLTIP